MQEEYRKAAMLCLRKQKRSTDTQLYDSVGTVTVHSFSTSLCPTAFSAVRRIKLII